MKAMQTNLTRHSIRPGDVFLVPLTDGTRGLGQVLMVTKEALDSCICALFSTRTANTAVCDQSFLDGAEVISVIFVTSELLKQGHWVVTSNCSVVVNADRYLPLRELEARKFVGAKVIGSGIVQKFLSAFHGLHPWDAWHDPNYLDKLLVSVDKRPENPVLLGKTKLQ
jgi:hypothetical protein